MRHPEQAYLDLLSDIYYHGVSKSDRTGIGTKSIFGPQIAFNLSDGFPLLTTKKVWFKGVVHELLWLLSGSTNIKYLVENNVHIWDNWADENGDLGSIYGKQWRKWQSSEGNEIDQIKNAIDLIKNNPDDRGIIVSAWNVGDLPKMRLRPCHSIFQFYVANGVLSCKLFQRSSDIAIGAPFNIASYSLLLIMISQICNLKPGQFIYSLGDAHLYNNLFEQVEIQLKRIPLPLPKIELNPYITNIDDFKYEDIKLIGYEHHTAIKMPIAV